MRPAFSAALPGVTRSTTTPPWGSGGPSFTLKPKKVYVIDDASEYGKGLADQVKSTLGAAVVGTDTIDTKATDYSGTVTKVKSSGADAVFFGGYYAQAGPLSKQLRDVGVTSAEDGLAGCCSVLSTTPWATGAEPNGPVQRRVPN